MQLQHTVLPWNQKTNIKCTKLNVICFSDQRTELLSLKTCLVLYSFENHCKATGILVQKYLMNIK